MQSYRNPGREPTIPMGRILFILLFLAVPGCSKDDTSPTAPSTATYPSVAGHWVGNDHALFFGGTVIRDWALEVNIVQSGASLAGTWLYTLTTAGSFKGSQTRASFIGTITTAGKVTFAETSWVALNWTGQNWGLNSYSGALSATMDTISGKGTSDTLNVSDTFVLVKQ